MSQRKEVPLPLALFLLLVQTFDSGDNGDWYTGVNGKLGTQSGYEEETGRVGGISAESLFAQRLREYL